MRIKLIELVERRERLERIERSERIRVRRFVERVGGIPERCLHQLDQGQER